MAFFTRKNTKSDEKRICAMCEFSNYNGDTFTCKGRTVDAAHSCRRFIFDPSKMAPKRRTLKDKDFEFESID